MIRAPAERHDLLPYHSPVIRKSRHDPLPAEAEDGDLVLARDDGAQVRAADAADVGHGDGAAGEVRGRELGREREGAQAGDLRGDVEDRQALHVLDVGDDEALRGVHRHTDVVGGAEDQAGLGRRGRNAGVEEGEGGKGEGEGFDYEGEVG